MACCEGNALTCLSLSLNAGQQITVVLTEAGVREIIFWVSAVCSPERPQSAYQAACQSGGRKIAGQVSDLEPGDCCMHLD